MQNPSMEQLAKELGVSKGLVSLALSGKYGVSEEMRTKIVLYAIQRGYDFSRRKGGNRKNVNVHTIGVLLNQDDLLAERFWPQILKGIEILNKLPKEALDALTKLGCAVYYIFAENPVY